MKKLTCLMSVLMYLHIGELHAQSNVFPPAGNVGIGTTSPTANLDVRGDVKWDGINAGNSRALKIGYSGSNYGGLGYNLDFTPATGIFNRPSTDQSSYLEFWHGGFRFYGASDAASVNNVDLSGVGSNLKFYATFTNSGNFGIGTFSPTEKFVVQQEIGRDAIAVYDGAGHTRLAVGQESAYTGNYIDSKNIDFKIKTHYLGGTGGNIMFMTQGDGTGNPNERMRIDKVGNVAIGTTDPQGYRLAVKGNMIAESVKVSLHGSWPDHVFHKTYSLRPLSQVEKYIMTNSHLPEIPSAAEVKKEGIDLGTMDAKLLQKIEELTLYLIEKDKQVTDLQARVKVLEAGK